MKKLSDEISRINSSIFKRKGKIFAGLMVNWGKIVGEKYTNLTYPKSIKEIRENGKIKKILHVGVRNSSVGMELSCHKEVMIERISIFFGFKAIDNIRIITE